MWSKSYSKVFKGINKKAVWQLWTDVNNWPKWDQELDYCKMDTAFIEGSQFILKPKGGPNVKIILSEVKPYEKFTDYCKFLGATMYDYHELEETSEGLLIKNTITVTGPLRFIWVNIIAKNVANSIPKNTEALVNLAKTI